MARIVRPSTVLRMAARLPPLRFHTALLVALACLGCAGPRERCTAVPAAPAVEVAERVLHPPESIANPADPAVVERAAVAATGLEPAFFTLDEAIAYALEFSPRLRAAIAAIDQASGKEQANFALFLPQVDLLSQMGTVSSTLAPGTPGNVGFIMPGDVGTRAYAEAELGMQWMLYDFGRIAGRYQQSVWQTRIAQLRLERARQSVEFDVAAAYLNVLLASATRRVEEEAVRRAESVLHDTNARRQSGDSLREDVLRAEVQLSESRENLIMAREREFDALARLNNVMGRNASLPLAVRELEAQPPLPGSLADLLSEAAAARPEVRIAQQAVAAAQAGRQVAQADFMPQIFVRASAGRTDGENVVTGWQEGAGLHLVSPIYDGGKRSGGLRTANAEIDAALADAQDILDAISLQVNLAFRGVAASRERIFLSRTAVAQAEENLRIVGVSYRNGNATPTDIVDGEAALTRAQQRYYSATYTYLIALARIDYVTGQHQRALPAAAEQGASEELPIHLPPTTDTMGPAMRPSPNRLPDIPSSPAPSLEP